MMKIRPVERVVPPHLQAGLSSSDLGDPAMEEPRTVHATAKPTTLQQLRESGWRSKPVKDEIYDNFIAALARGDELFPGIIGFEDTVIPEINNAIIAKHVMLFMGE